MKKKRFNLRKFIAALLLGTPLAACGGVKDPVSDDFAALAGADEKSDAFSTHMKIVGSLDYNTLSDEVSYANPPRYRVFKFSGQPGDKVDVWVRSDDGDAVAWVLDNNFKIVAMNDDADATTLDAHVTAVLPASRSNTHYLAFRDYGLGKAHFRVQLEGAPAVKFCDVDDDCVRVQAACCPTGHWDAVAKGEEQAFRSDVLKCPAAQICPLIAYPDDHSMAECSAAHTCLAVKPADIACGGFRTDAHVCPTGYDCVGPSLSGDGPGHCTASK